MVFGEIQEDRRDFVEVAVTTLQVGLAARSCHCMEQPVLAFSKFPDFSRKFIRVTLTLIFERQVIGQKLSAAFRVIGECPVDSPYKPRLAHPHI